MIAMEAMIYSGWLYCFPYEKVKVAHPLMLRAIAPAMEPGTFRIGGGSHIYCGEKISVRQRTPEPVSRIGLRGSTI
jgi:hypothetical protein